MKLTAAATVAQSRVVGQTAHADHAAPANRPVPGRVRCSSRPFLSLVTRPDRRRVRRGTAFVAQAA